MSEKRILHLHLKYKWYDQIASGEKSCEMRLATDRWRKRLIGQHYDEIHLYRGYPKREDYGTDRLIRKWTCVAKETVKHEEFGDEPVEVFVIDVSQKPQQIQMSGPCKECGTYASGEDYKSSHLCGKCLWGDQPSPLR